MKLTESEGRTFVVCPKCGQNIVWPEKLSAEEKKSVAGISRRSRPEAAKFARSAFALDLHEAKALAYHISDERGRCHRCASLVAGEISVCAKCRSVNLDW